MDEPAALASEVEKYRTRLPQAYEDVEVRSPSRRSATSSARTNGPLALQLFPGLALKQLELSREGEAVVRALRTQPTARYRGNVAAFVAEAKGRLTAGEQVMVSAASTGELERYTDICHEYELPYRLGELEENVRSHGSQKRAAAGNPASSW